MGNVTSGSVWIRQSLKRALGRKALLAGQYQSVKGDIITLISCCHGSWQGGGGKVTVRIRKAPMCRQRWSARLSSTIQQHNLMKPASWSIMSFSSYQDWLTLPSTCQFGMSILPSIAPLPVGYFGRSTRAVGHAEVHHLFVYYFPLYRTACLSR